jgi:hypothetical protein
MGIYEEINELREHPKTRKFTQRVKERTAKVVTATCDAVSDTVDTVNEVKSTRAARKAYREELAANYEKATER